MAGAWTNLAGRGIKSVSSGKLMVRELQTEWQDTDAKNDKERVICD